MLQNIPPHLQLVQKARIFTKVFFSIHQSTLSKTVDTTRPLNHNKTKKQLNFHSGDFGNA